MAYLVRAQDRAPAVTTPVDPDPTLPRACIIGGGSSGIAAAKQAGAPVVYVDPNGEFANHRYCDDEPWLINLHPSAEGQEAYAAAFEAEGGFTERLYRTRRARRRGE